MTKILLNISVFFLLMEILFEFPKADAGQNLPTRSVVLNSSSDASALDRLTLTLIDRLPTERDRDLIRAHGSRGAFELANHLINTREFFDRQSLYWQTQLSQTPAWLWESQKDPAWLFHAARSTSARQNTVWFVRAPRGGGETTCSGVWTTLDEDRTAKLCGCDDTVAVLPSWDSSASMRVCPHVKNDDYCGSSLQKCVPADARFDPTNKILAIDNESAGGRAITRLLSDLALTQGRAFATAIVSNQKWSQISSQPMRTAHSRSSIDLVKKWSLLSPENPITAIGGVLKVAEFSMPLRTLLNDPLPVRKRYSTQPLAETAAEELILSNELDARLRVHPLRSTYLDEHVWKWNTELLFTCQIPHLAPQLFSLPLPHPGRAKEGAYFCSSCHLELDKINKKGIQKSAVLDEKTWLTGVKSDPHLSKQCAVEHALNFLLGYRPSGAQASHLKKVGALAYQNNNESLSAVIRDIALEIIRGGEK